MSLCLSFLLPCLRGQDRGDADNLLGHPVLPDPKRVGWEGNERNILSSALVQVLGVLLSSTALGSFSTLSTRSKLKDFFLNSPFCFLLAWFYRSGNQFWTSVLSPMLALRPDFVHNLASWKCFLNFTSYNRPIFSDFLNHLGTSQWNQGHLFFIYGLRLPFTSID